ncbi:MAG: hypothetical protein KatS3mg002_0580 [Candidatus Woesearchaeota archaeon]|nr:MAG: hypothetical protein KatS3mg002_0580 [Candidatus Woesearchaeota archaeon]
MFFKNKKWVIIVFLLIFVSGCSVGPNKGSNYIKKYYQGYDSLELRFLDESPPSRFYYDPEGYNEIPIVVELKNKGSSYAFGSLYIHGYDPNIIEVAGGATPTRNHITYNFQSGLLSFSIGNIYVGISGKGGSTKTTIGWNKNGKYYGGSVFTNDGKIVGLNLNLKLDNNIIGMRLANTAFGALNSYFGWNTVIALPGDTPENPGGGMEVYEFPAYIYYLPESLEQFRQPIMVTACYTYETRASTMICIDPKPNSNAKKACIARDVSLSGGQGAPVAVTRVQQQSSSGKVVLTINIKHNKKNSLDDLFDVNQLFYKCDPHAGEVIKPSDKNIVDILSVELSGMDITDTCSGGGRIRLDQSGNGQFTCTAYLDRISEAAYEAPLTVSLGYGYSKNIYKEILIKRI